LRVMCWVCGVLCVFVVSAVVADVGLCVFAAGVVWCCGCCSVLCVVRAVVVWCVCVPRSVHAIAVAGAVAAATAIAVAIGIVVAGADAGAVAVDVAAVLSLLVLCVVRLLLF